MACGQTNDSQIAALKSLGGACQPMSATPHHRATLVPWLNLVSCRTRDHGLVSSQKLPERRAGDNVNWCNGGKQTDGGAAGRLQQRGKPVIRPWRSILDAV